jgi:cell fate (sporulation/competence/biofilm development) regulator YlbF (YheA/YmcA/DUF963 family)
MTIPGEECDLCIQTLDEACQRFGADYCELRSKYQTTSMSTVEVTAELVQRMEPEQREVIRQALIDKGAAIAR